MNGMNDIDEALSRLARAKAPAALDGLEARVLARIATPPASRDGFGVGAVALAALAIGIVGARFPASRGAAASLSLPGASAPFAPSTLLAGAQ